MNPTSLLVWYPIVSITGVPQPLTHTVDVSDLEVVYIIDGLSSPVINQVLSFCDSIGYPAFMRTAYYSAKFEGHCIVRDPSSVVDNLKGLLVSSLVEEKPIESICIREFISSHSMGYFRDTGFPIGAERRYFTEDGAVVSHYPYWTQLSIGGEDCCYSKEVMDSFNYESSEEVDLLTGYCEQFLSAVKQTEYADVDWSIDFMKDKYGKWWLIDMGEAYKSMVP